MDRLKQVKDEVVKWIGERAKQPTTTPTRDALEFMLGRLKGAKTKHPKAWTDAGVRRREQEEARPGERITLQEAAALQLSAIKKHADVPSSNTSPRGPALAATTAAAEANAIAARVRWPLYTAGLDVADALFPTRLESRSHCVTETALRLTIGASGLKETERIPLRLSTILGLLPQMPESQFTQRDIAKAIEHLDKLRMDEELDRCYDALEESLEYYHELEHSCRACESPESPADLSPHGDGYGNQAYCDDGAKAARWALYNEKVLTHRYNSIAFGWLGDIEERVPDNHPYLSIVKEIVWKPRTDPSIKHLAGEHYHRLLIENATRLTTATLGYVEAKLNIIDDYDEA